MGRLLVDAARLDKFRTVAIVVRLITLTGCRRSEIVGFKWADVDLESSCLRLSGSNEGA